jgi:hypothetical protein
LIELRSSPQIAAEFPNKARLLRQAGFVFVAIDLLRRQLSFILSESVAADESKA